MKKLFLSFIVVCMSLFASATNYLTFTSVSGTSYFSLSTTGSPGSTIEYSFDGVIWNTLTASNVTLSNTGDFAYLRGTNTSISLNTSNYQTFVMSGSISASGSIMSLLDGIGEATTISTVYCFYHLFYNCVSLTTTPELPATSLAKACYYSLFNGCTALTSTPLLPATIVPQYGYRMMFNGCTNLSVLSNLPATSVGDSAYLQMFQNCTSIVTPMAILPATILGKGCYRSMFYGCSKLATAPILPATNLNDWCYRSMFYGCALITTPDLPATILAPNCYSNMFYNCTNLTSASIISATTLANSCFYQMFYNCTSLQRLEVGFTSWTGVTTPTTKWLYNVSSIGCFISPNALPTERGVDKIPTSWQHNTQYLTFKSSSTSYIQLVNTGTPTNVGVIEYSIDDGNTWSTLTTSSVSVSSGVTAYLRGSNTHINNSATNYISIALTGSFTGGGNIMSLLDNTGMSGSTTISNPYCFAYLFKNSTGLTNANILMPATTLSLGCYYGLFEGCTSLTKVPILPAMNLAEKCYQWMFSGCTSLTTSPVLPANNLAVRCYYGMFYNCSLLTTAPQLPATNLEDYCYCGLFEGCTALVTPPLLPATTLAEKCYSCMFYGCTSLNTMPDLPAMSLANGCYSIMFYECSSLTTATSLPATTLAANCYSDMFHGCTLLNTAPALPATTMYPSCYKNMFYGCTALTTAPALPATTLAKDCYNGMFYSCSSLTSVPVLVAAILSEKCYFEMFRGCTSLITPPDMSAITTAASNCCSGMFHGCTSLTTPPVLSATTLAINCYSWMFKNCPITIAPELSVTTLFEGCYQYMFQNCTSLNSAPELPATVLAKKCYANMFYGCSSIKNAPSLYATTLADSCYYQMFYNCTSLNRIDVAFTAWTGATNPTLNWVQGVATLGKFVAPDALTDLRGISNIPTAWQYKTDYLTFRAVSGSTTIYLNKIGSPSGVVYYSKDGTWNQLTGSSVSLSAGEAVYVRGNNTKISDDENNYQNFSITSGSVEASGNIMSLLDNNGNLGTTTITEPWCFYRLFYNSTALTTAPELPATSLSEHCYQALLMGCTALVLPPDLPALSVPHSAYRALFSGCTALTTAPDLPATSYAPVACWNMFYGNSNLTSIPTNLTTTNMGDSCFARMFWGCTKITYSPNINAVNMGRMSCSEMFSGCTKLVTANDITATTIGEAACDSMFYGCTALTTVGDINVTNIGKNACARMFRGCTSLETVGNLAATSIAHKGCWQMFYGCSLLRVPPTIHAISVGTFACMGMFYNCTSLTYAPNLPATTIDRQCYSQMFYGCKALITPPASLPALTMRDSCYHEMFRGCSEMTTAIELPSINLAPHCYRGMFRGTKLSTASDLPATILAPDCYRYMYADCKSLVNAPKISATAIALRAFYYMFSGCTALQIAPKLLAEPNESLCYAYMFNGCTSLRRIHVTFTNWGIEDDAFTNWVASVPENSEYVFVAPEALPDERGVNRIPNNWNLYRRHTATLRLNGHGSWDGVKRSDSIIVDGSFDLPNLIVDDGYTFINWNSASDGSGARIGSPTTTVVLTSDTVIYAYYISNWASNIDVINWGTNAIVIKSTETFAHISTQVYQNATPIDMTNAVPLTLVNNDIADCLITGDIGTYSVSVNGAEILANPGDVLLLTVKDANNNQIGQAIITIPILVNSSQNISTYSPELCSDIDIQVLDGGILTIDADRSCENVKIQGGGKLVVPSGRTLTASTVTMQGGDIENGTYQFRYPQLVVNGHISSATGKINYDYLLDASQYYTLALPYDVNISDITYRDGTVARCGLNGVAKYDYRIQYYDGSARTSGGTGWANLPAGTLKLNAGQGYTVFAKPRAVRLSGGASQRQKYAILRMPMTVDFSSASESQKTVSVTAYGNGDGSVRDNDKGWNLVGNPYLASLTSETGLTSNGIGLLVDDGDGGYEWSGTSRYVVIPSNDGQSYSQILATEATLPAFKNFFVQIGSGDALDFTLANRAQNMAMRREAALSEESVLALYLRNNSASDRMGVLVSDRFTTDYEINADLQKWLNNGLNVYALGADDRLAHIAVDDAAAKTIPLGYAATSASDYTFALDARYDMSDWAEVWLYDAQTKQHVNLLSGNYTFRASVGTHDDRFTLSLVRADKQPLPTDVPAVNILPDGQVRVYDMLGRYISDTTLGLTAGVYLVWQGGQCRKMYID